jgi:hypothetical protein
MHYEDLLGDPAGTLRRISGVLGLPETAELPFLRGGEVELAPAHTVSGNPMRFRTGAVPLRRDDSWRRKMTVADRRLVSALTLPLLLRYRYVPDRREA